ncbi:DUF6603 domain-containing protein [Streptomyces spectabilis]|uniref:DUF6603 domain-containing protein n=1 Tax=Streptomyces spectabilis TaxID=68270 RepID=A0A7W8B590_STRST|nr:DUF6603 domain-containing protein [Streptomyces spectabilis]MBB5109941.1 hypothetical protein [Streptomyces spectabilis]
MLLGELRLNAGLRIPLIDSALPAGARIGVDKVTMGYNSVDLTPDALNKVKERLGQLPDGYVSQKGPQLVAAIRVGDRVHPLVFAPTLRPQTAAVTGEMNALTPAPSYVEGAGGGAVLGVTQPASGTGSSDATAWLDLNASVGPVHVGRIGAGYEAGRLLLLADVDVNAGGLSFGTKGLGAGIPLSDPAHPVLHLNGLSVGYSRPPLTIAGELVRRDMGPDYELAVGGMAVVQTPAAGVTATGFYAQKTNGDPSFFCFGVLDLSKRSAGSPVFRLEKLAAGFGYHTQVRTPKFTEVGNFPFVRMLSATETVDNPLQQLDALLNGGWVKSAPGEMWLAAGLEALVYELVHINGVAVVQFGDELVAGLYGHVVATFPKMSTTPWAKLAVDARAEYRSSADTLEFDAALTDDSFVLDRNCQLTGGVAVRLWFGGSAHPGEFVVSVGGYHPQFDIPAHYPRPARLGFDWHISDAIHAWGSCYAALTPHAFMAGINAGLRGQWGPATIDASVYADAIIEWDPLYFNVAWGGRVSASLFGLKAEVSADGTVWGPPVGGFARVNVGPFHIGVDFGTSDPKQHPKLTPKEFRERMLPGGTKPDGTPANSTVEDSKVVALSAAKGLLPLQPSGATASGTWAFGLQEFACQASTSVPLTSVSVNGTAVTEGITRKALEIRPMQVTDVSSAMTITVKHKETNAVARVGAPSDANDVWGVVLDTRGVPSALWDTTALASDGNGLVNGYASAVTLAPPPPRHAKKVLIPATAMRAKTPIVMKAEDKPQDYTSTNNNDRLPTMTDSQLIDVSAAAANKARSTFLGVLKTLSIPGFSDDLLTENLSENVFSNGAVGYIDALPQILAR